MSTGRLESVLTSGFCRDINFLIMDYLINEGYPAAAKKFAFEAKIQPTQDFDMIQERVDIRRAIHKGDIQTAIENINEVNPQVRCVNQIFSLSLSFAMIILFHAPLITLRGIDDKQLLDFSPQYEQIHIYRFVPRLYFLRNFR
jgi:glucose-induced degradation protein 8